MLAQKYIKKYLLFTPWPVNITNNVRMTIFKEDISHREKDFDVLLLSIEDKLLQLFSIKEKINYRAVVITWSWTSANESILSSVVGEKNILVVSNWEFWERLFDISKIHNENTFLLKFNWWERFNLEWIEQFLINNPIDIISIVHHETSSGMLNSLEDIGELSRKYNVTFIVDAVSSAGAENIDMEKNNISFCSSSSSKAISSYPWLSFVIWRKEAFETLKDLPIKTMYLNLYKFYTFINLFSQTPNTPAVHLFFALEQALINILDEWVIERHDSIKKKANILRVWMKDMWLKFLINEKDMCNVLTTILVPEYIKVTTIREKLKDKFIIIYEWKWLFKDKVFQVWNIWELSFDEITFFLRTLKNILEASKNITLTK
jgi:2-aminoethylphosphonate-pyruvate transaminase